MPTLSSMWSTAPYTSGQASAASALSAAYSTAVAACSAWAPRWDLWLDNPDGTRTLVEGTGAAAVKAEVYAWTLAFAEAIVSACADQYGAAVAVERVLEARVLLTRGSYDPSTADMAKREALTLLDQAKTRAMVALVGE